MQRVSNAEGHSESKPSCMTQPAHVYTSADDAGSMPRCGRAAKLERRMFLRRRGWQMCNTGAYLSRRSTSQSCQLQRYAATQHSALPIERLSQCTLFTYICLIALTLPSQIPQLFVVTWNCDGSPRHVRGNPVALAPHAQRLSWTLKPPRSLHSRQDGTSSPLAGAFGQCRITAAPLGKATELRCGPSD